MRYFRENHFVIIALQKKKFCELFYILFLIESKSMSHDRESDSFCTNWWKKRLVIIRWIHAYCKFNWKSHTFQTNIFLSKFHREIFAQQICVVQCAFCTFHWKKFPLHLYTILSLSLTVCHFMECIYLGIFICAHTEPENK